MNKNAIIAIAVAVVVVAAGGVGFMLMNKSTDPSYEKTDMDLNKDMLMILGNADCNTSIDNNDVKKINEIIADGAIEYKSNEEKYVANYMADANHDNVINEDDAKYVESMINGTAKTLNYVNVEKEIKSFKVSEKSYLVTGQRTYARSAVLLANASDKVTIVGGSNTSINEAEFKDVVANIGSMKDLGLQKEMSVEGISQLADDYSDGNIVVLTGASAYYCDGYESKFDGDRIQMVRMIAWEGSALSGLLTVGYLLDGVGNNGSTGAFGQAKAYETFYHKYADPITDYVSTLAENQKLNVVACYIAKDINGATIHNIRTTENTFRNESTADYQMTVLAGGNNAIGWFKGLGAGAYGGNGTWTLEGLAAGLQGHDLDCMIIGVNMFLPAAGDTLTVMEQYDQTGNDIVTALRTYLPTDVDVYLKNYNFTGIPYIMDLVFNAKVLCKDSPVIQGYDFEVIWNEYLALYGANPTTSNLAYSNIAIGSGPYHTTA